LADLWTERSFLILSFRPGRSLTGQFRRLFPVFCNSRNFAGQLRVPVVVLKNNFLIGLWAERSFLVLSFRPGRSFTGQFLS
jgi:hypothetical protein